MGKKLSEAVQEMTNYDVLPDVKPEDLEINSVAALPEPLADAKARNKANREKFFNMIKTQTEKARKDLKIDDELKNRQVGGNGILVEDVEPNKDTSAVIYDVFKNTRWKAYDDIKATIQDSLVENDIYDEAAFYKINDKLNKKLTSLFLELNSDYNYWYNNHNAKYIEYTAADEGKRYGESISKEKPKKNLTEAVKISVKDYKPRNGTTLTYKRIQEADKLDYLENLLEEIYPDGIDAQTLNDLLWFDADWILEILGIEVEE